MKIKDYQKEKAILEDVRNVNNFYDEVIHNIKYARDSAVYPDGDIFERIKVLDFVIKYLELEKKTAMEKAWKLIKEI